METTDIVIHKGEKEEKYQLYVEDYVMSFLKNYGTANGRKIFFYGTREQKNRKYYIYGAGRQKNISYFVRYELLDEIVCSFDMDKPVFFIKEDSGRYELSGYYIFYQSNEAMQSYMIEQRKGNESEEKAQDKLESPSNIRAQDKPELRKIRPQDFSDIRARSRLKSTDETEDGVEKQSNSNVKQLNNGRTYVHRRREVSSKSKGGIMAFQLSAVFLVLAAIIINSTNSYSKLRELGQSAVEVFFAMENQEAAKAGNDMASGDGQVSGISGETGTSGSSDISTASGSTDTSGSSDISTASGSTDTSDASEILTKTDITQGTVLRLEDLDAEFEKENQEAKGGTNNLSTQETDNGENVGSTEENGEDVGDKVEQGKESVEDAAVENKESAGDEGKQDKENPSTETEQNKETAASESTQGDNSAASNEESPSKEAFARNFAQYYKIEKGDTLCNISIKLYGDASKVNEICEINKIDDPNNIKYGQKILLP